MGKPTNEEILQASRALVSELYRAKEQHNWFNSRHEGYAVLLEEVDELWDVIKGDGSPTKIYEEAIQIGAMALEMAVQYGLPQASEETA